MTYIGTKSNVRLIELYRERDEAAAEALTYASLSPKKFQEATEKYRHLTKCINEMLLDRNVITNIEGAV